MRGNLGLPREGILEKKDHVLGLTCDPHKGGPYGLYILCPANSMQVEEKERSALYKPGNRKTLMGKGEERRENKHEIEVAQSTPPPRKDGFNNCAVCRVSD